MVRPFSKALAPVLILLAATGCGSGSEPNPTPDPTGSATLSVSSGTASVLAGASTTVTATVVRAGGFTGPVTVAATGMPAGVTISGGTIASGSTSQVLTITASAGATVGSSNLSVTGEDTDAGTGPGITITPAALTLTVTALPPPPPPSNEILGETGGDQSGTTVALSADGSRVIIGSPFNDGTGSSAGHARVFERANNTWTQLGSDLDGEAADDRLGGAVAMSDDGSRVAVGSYLNDGGGGSSGHVRVFDYTGGAWTQVGADIDGESGRGSGWAVAMSATGDRVVTGGPGVGSVNGHVKVYEFAAGSWTQVGATIAGGAELGHAVSMSDDGNRIALSYPSASGSSQPGFTQVYDWNGTAWVQVGATIAGEDISDFSGGALALSGDGNTLAIGAENNVGGGVSGGGAKGGHVRVYSLVGGTWTQVGADIDGPQAIPSGGGFGSSVSLSADGTRLISTGQGGGKASVGVFTLSANTWTKSATPDFGTGGRMGGVAISADGTTIAVGEIYYAGPAGNSQGVVRFYPVP